MSVTASLREVSVGMDAYGESPPASMLALAARFRWEDGWQGSGPLSVSWLLRSRGSTSLRGAFSAMGDAPPTSVRAAYGRMGLPGDAATRLPDGPVSLREMASRTHGSATVPVRFLSYNTYLLQGLQVPLDRWVDDVVGWDALEWFGIPFGGALLVSLGLTSVPALALGEVLELAGLTPSKVIRTLVPQARLDGVRILPKPALDERGSELGSVVGQYDLSCLCEVWTQDSRTRLATTLTQDPTASWQYAAGPDESGSWTLAGSGLVCAVKDRPVNRRETIVFDDLGVRQRDSDAWSHKGAMLSVVATEVGDLELFQTHLYYGGGIPGVSNPTEEQRAAVWDAELQQLSAFITEHHDPTNVAILTGDFNIDGADLDTYARLCRTTHALNLYDHWTRDVFGNVPWGGRTCRYTDGDIGGWDRDFREAGSLRTGGAAAAPPFPSEPAPVLPDVTCDDRPPGGLPPLRHLSGVGRYDYVFVERPTARHVYRLELSRIRRRPFPRAAPSDGEPYLSDHLGLDLTMFLSPR